MGCKSSKEKEPKASTAPSSPRDALAAHTVNHQTSAAAAQGTGEKANAETQVGESRPKGSDVDYVATSTPPHQGENRTAHSDATTASRASPASPTPDALPHGASSPRPSSSRQQSPVAVMPSVERSPSGNSFSRSTTQISACDSPSRLTSTAVTSVPNDAPSFALPTIGKPGPLLTESCVSVLSDVSGLSPQSAYASTVPPSRQAMHLPRLEASRASSTPRTPHPREDGPLLQSPPSPAHEGATTMEAEAVPSLVGNTIGHPRTATSSPALRTPLSRAETETQPPASEVQSSPIARDPVKRQVSSSPMLAPLGAARTGVNRGCGVSPVGRSPGRASPTPPRSSRRRASVSSSHRDSSLEKYDAAFCAQQPHRYGSPSGLGQSPPVVVIEPSPVMRTVRGNNSGCRSGSNNGTPGRSTVHVELSSSGSSENNSVDEAEGRATCRLFHKDPSTEVDYKRPLGPQGTPTSERLALSTPPKPQHALASPDPHQNTDAKESCSTPPDDSHTAVPPLRHAKPPLSARTPRGGCAGSTSNLYTVPVNSNSSWTPGDGHTAASSARSLGGYTTTYPSSATAGDENKSNAEIVSAVLHTPPAKSILKSSRPTSHVGGGGGGGSSSVHHHSSTYSGSMNGFSSSNNTSNVFFAYPSASNHNVTAVTSAADRTPSPFAANVLQPEGPVSASASPLRHDFIQRPPTPPLINDASHSVTGLERGSFSSCNHSGSPELATLGQLRSAHSPSPRVQNSTTVCGVGSANSSFQGPQPQQQSPSPPAFKSDEPPPDIQLVCVTTTSHAPAPQKKVRIVVT